jgi:hypothetical protein
MTQRQMYTQIREWLQQQQQQQQNAADTSGVLEQQLQQQQDVSEQTGSGHVTSAPPAAAAAAAAEHQCDADVTSMLLLMLSRLRIRPSESWMQLYSRLLQQLLPNMSAVEVSRTLLGLAGLGYSPEPALAGQLLQRTQQLLPYLRSKELIRTMHALGKLRIAPSEAWLEVFYAAVQASGGLQVSGFGMVVWGLAKLGAKPSQAWMEQLMCSTFGDINNSSSSSSSGEVVALAARGLKPQHLANLLCAFAKLGFVPGVQWMSWFRAQLAQAGALQELDHFHIEWAWRELNEQYRAAAGVELQVLATDNAAAVDAITSGGSAAGSSSSSSSG